MKLLVNTKQSQHCAARTQSLDQLSKVDLQQRKIAAEEMLVVLGLLGCLVIGMAIWSGLYPLAPCSVGMQPAFSDYLTRHRAIVNRLNQRR